MTTTLPFDYSKFVEKFSTKSIRPVKPIVYAPVPFQTQRICKHCHAQLFNTLNTVCCTECMIEWLHTFGDSIPLCNPEYEIIGGKRA